MANRDLNSEVQDRGKFTEMLRTGMIFNLQERHLMELIKRTGRPIQTNGYQPSPVEDVGGSKNYAPRENAED